MLLLWCPDRHCITTLSIDHQIWRGRAVLLLSPHLLHHTVCRLLALSLPHIWGSRGFSGISASVAIECGITLHLPSSAADHNPRNPNPMRLLDDSSAIRFDPKPGEIGIWIWVRRGRGRSIWQVETLLSGQEREKEIAVETEGCPIFYNLI